MCISVCTTTNAGAGFSITTNSAVPGNSLLGVGNNAQGYCTYDNLGIRSATDSTSGLMGDRFCGEQLNTARAPNGANSSIQLCCKLNANIIIHMMYILLTANIIFQPKLNHLRLLM